ncbi:hypothetical protein BGY98DRAFT_938890 [Russula aff. rugulosa BPL654]|nr:hypothetical protein BGY98DRAFT_938890 [Russula aff. rugulosa BPL654]
MGSDRPVLSLRSDRQNLALDGTTCPRPTWLGAHQIRTQRQRRLSKVGYERKATGQTRIGRWLMTGVNLGVRGKGQGRMYSRTTNTGNFGHVAGSRKLHRREVLSIPRHNSTRNFASPWGKCATSTRRFSRARRFVGATSASPGFGTGPGFLIKVSFKSAFDPMLRSTESLEESPARRPDSANSRNPQFFLYHARGWAHAVAKPKQFRRKKKRKRMRPDSREKRRK